VPEMQFAMIDGQVETGVLPGDSPEFAGAIGALYGVSYTLKFMSKQRPLDPVDYTVMALEGLWSAPQNVVDQAGAGQAMTDQAGIDPVALGAWPWTLMIMQPDHVTPEMFVEAQDRLRERLAKKGSDGGDPALLDRVRLERFAEGLCIQTMHVGPYADEARTLERMGVFAGANGYALRGRHHEIYLGDPRAAKPENLKTVLRHPVMKVDSLGGEKGAP